MPPLSILLSKMASQTGPGLPPPIPTTCYLWAFTSSSPWAFPRLSVENGTGLLIFSFPETPLDVALVCRQPSWDSRPTCLLLPFLSFSFHPFGLSRVEERGRGALFTSLSSYPEIMLPLAYKKMSLVLDMIMENVLVIVLSKKQNQ